MQNYNKKSTYANKIYFIFPLHPQIPRSISQKYLPRQQKCPAFLRGTDDFFNHLFLLICFFILYPGLLYSLFLTLFSSHSIIFRNPLLSALILFSLLSYFFNLPLLESRRAFNPISTQLRLNYDSITTQLRLNTIG